MAIDGMKVKPGMEVATVTDVGHQRENNEDSFLYWEPESDEEAERQLVRRPCVWSHIWATSVA